MANALTAVAAPLLCAIALFGCGVEPLADKQVVRCKKIIEDYSPVERYRRVTNDHGVVELRFSVKSALGLRAGSASCHYPAAGTQPIQVRIGNVVLVTASDIESLISGKYLNGVGLHTH